MSNVFTFGCRVNSYETEQIKAVMLEAGLGEDVVVINSCAVTNKTESDILRFVRKTKKNNPDKKIIFTGCAAQANPAKYSKIPEIDFLIGNNEKTSIESYLKIQSQMLNPSTIIDKTDIIQSAENLQHKDKLYQSVVGDFGMSDSGRISVSNIMNTENVVKTQPISYFEGRTRAFVQIQNGCNHRCTFCIIPYGRGNSRSSSVGDIVTQINTLVSSGYKEIVLTGVDITDYGKDLPNTETLATLIATILLKCPNLPRLRLSSVDVAEIGDSLRDIIATEKRLMPYFHISLQSGDDMVLKQMARRHNRMDVINFCKFVKSVRKDAMFGSDIISGFPTETDVAFANSALIIEECGIAFNHIFTFSPKLGTPAAKMKDLPISVKKERTAALIKKGSEMRLKCYEEMMGLKLPILMESGGVGRAENFAKVLIPEYNGNENIFVNVEIIGLTTNGDCLLGKNLL